MIYKQYDSKNIFIFAFTKLQMFVSQAAFVYTTYACKVITAHNKINIVKLSKSSLLIDSKIFIIR